MRDLSLFDLSGKKALVTGGGKGIGRACAIALAMAGADVAIAGRDSEAGAATAATLARMGSAAFFVPCDISRRSDVEAMVAAVVNRFTRLDVAVNNSGVACEGADEEQSE